MGGRATESWSAWLSGTSAVLGAPAPQSPAEWPLLVPLPRRASQPHASRLGFYCLTCFGFHVPHGRSSCADLFELKRSFAKMAIDEEAIEHHSGTMLRRACTRPPAGTGASRTTRAYEGVCGGSKHRHRHTSRVGG